MVELEKTEPIQKPGSRNGLSVLLSKYNPKNENYFMVSGVGGHVISFQLIARRVAHYRNGFGLMYPAFFREATRPITIRNIAEDMLESLLNTQGEGNYVLSGYSMGALVCMELADLLIEKGHNAGVILIDQKVTESRIFKSNWAQLPVWWYWQYRQFHDKYFFDIKNEKLRRRREGLVYHLDEKNKISNDSFDRVIAEGREALKNYTVRKYDVPTVLLRTRDEPWYQTKFSWPEDYGWTQFTNLLDIVYCEGDHISLMKGRNVSSFSQHFEEAMKKFKFD